MVGVRVWVRVSVWVRVVVGLVKGTFGIRVRVGFGLVPGLLFWLWYAVRVNNTQKHNPQP